MSRVADGLHTSSDSASCMRQQRCLVASMQLSRQILHVARLQFAFPLDGGNAASEVGVAGTRNTLQLLVRAEQHVSSSSKILGTSLSPGTVCPLKSEAA